MPAALCGHKHLLRWFRQYDSCGGEVCESAASGGHFELLVWARRKGYPWGRTTLKAAWFGRLDIAQWARQEGCPWYEGRAKPRRLMATWPSCSGRLAAGAARWRVLSALHMVLDRGAGGPRASLWDASLRDTKICNLATCRAKAAKLGHGGAVAWLDEWEREPRGPSVPGCPGGARRTSRSRARSRGALLNGEAG